MPQQPKKPAPTTAAGAEAEDALGLHARAEGGSALFHLSAQDASPDDSLVMPIYVPEGFAPDASPQATTTSAEDDDDLMPIYVGATLSHETSTLFALAKLGARGKPAFQAAPPETDPTTPPTSLDPTPRPRTPSAGGSTLFRLDDLATQPLWGDDADDRADDDLMPIYLPPGLDTAPPLAPPSPPMTARAAPPLRYDPAAEAALDAHLQQAAKTAQVPTPTRPRPDRPQPNRPQPNRPQPDRPQPDRPQPTGRAVPASLWDVDSSLLPLTLADTRPASAPDTLRDSMSDTAPVSAKPRSHAPMHTTIARPRSVSAPFQLEPPRATLHGLPGVQPPDHDLSSALRAALGLSARSGDDPAPNDRLDWVNALPQALQSLPRRALVSVITRLLDQPLPATPDNPADDAPNTDRWQAPERHLLRWLSGRLPPGTDARQALRMLRDALSP